MRSLHRHKFAVHTIALTLMLFSAGALYWAAQTDAQGGMLVFLLLFALANFLILWV